MTATSYATTVAGNVRAEMGRAAYSQTRLAKHLGYTQQALSRRLTGLVAFDVNELATISDVLGIPVDRLFREHELAS